MPTSLDTIREDLRLARRSFDDARGPWLAVIATCVAVTVAATVVGQRIGGFSGYLFGEFRFEGQYAGVMTAATAFFLGAAGASLFAVAWLFARDPRTRALTAPWVVAAAGMFVLGADDLLFVHEIIAYRLAARGVPRIIGDNLMLAVYVVATVAVLPRLLEAVRRYWKSMFPLVFGLAMFALSVLTELLIPSEGWLVSVIDRFGKVTGTVMMFAFAQTLLIAVASDPDRAASRATR